VLDADDLADLGDDDNEAKDLAEDTDFFLAEESMMQDIGRYLGTVLGPRGKMPDPISPDDDVVELVERLKNSVQIRSGERRTFHTRVGAEDMSAEDIADNIDVIIRRLEAGLEKGPLNLDTIYVKTTMGPAVEVV
jgi:large subunit ribosomal protein L1